MPTENEAKPGDRASGNQTQSPPSSLTGIIRRLGPGMIVAGSIVGSGELIATTSTGAQAGFWLLWLILIGCVIKVFVQVEFGRYAISSGRTTMSAMAEVPGPRIPGRGNWLIWFWFAMFLASIAQLGGIVGGVGQALSISAPLTGYGSTYNQYAEAQTQLIVDRAMLRRYAEEASLEPEPRNRPEAIDDRILAAELHSARRLRDLLDHRRQRLSAKSDPSSESALESIEERLQAVIELADLLSAWIEDPDARADQEGGISIPPVESAVDRAALSALLTALGERIDLTDQRTELTRELERLEDGDRRDELLEQSESLDARLAENGRRVIRQSTALSESEPRWESAVQLVPDLVTGARVASKPDAPVDDKVWAAIVTALTVLLLINGRFGLIQSFSTAMVAAFTAITIANLFLLQSSVTWGVSLENIIDGMRFRLPPGSKDGSSGLATALKAFGIIGVGASELVSYPYWCLEKGYARFTGPRDETDSWASRARGWMRVMRWDAWCSMVVYTFATIAFYLLGAAVLGRTQLFPGGSEMIRYLSVMYEPVFGSVAQVLFLFGAFAVLYSTFFVANASHARVFSDALRVLGLAPNTERAYRNRVRLFSGLFPVICLVIYVLIPEPTRLVLLSGLMQALMLPMLAAAALFFRYRRCDRRITSGPVWDAFLWLSALGMLISGGWLAWTQIAPLL